MAPMWARLLTKNGIIKSPGTSGELYCALCDCETSYASCQQHARSPQHRQREERFFRVFEVSGDQAKCQICAIHVDWRRAREHTERHTLIPWSEPPQNYDRYKIFFDNAIIQWNDVFRCCLCDESFDVWDLALVHITDSEHRRRRKSDALSMDFEPTEVGATWESLVRECLIPSPNGSELRCVICENRCMPLGSVERHVKGLLHLSCKSKFRLPVKECEADGLSTTLFPQDWQNQEERQGTTDVACQIVRSPNMRLFEYCQSKREETKAIDTNCKVVCSAETQLRENIQSKREQSKTIDTNCKVVRSAEAQLRENIQIKREQLKAIDTNRKIVHSSETQRPQNHQSKKEQTKAIDTVCKFVRSTETQLPENRQIKKEQTKAIDTVCKIVRSTETQLPENRQIKKEQTKAIDTACKIVRLAETQLPENRQSKTEQSKTTDAAREIVRLAETLISENSQSKTESSEQSKATKTSRKRPQQVKVRSIAGDLDYILKEPNCTWYCVICDCPLKERSVSSHAAEKNHVVALNRFGCEAVSLKHGVEFYCGYCDATMSGLDNVYQHVTGKRHLKKTKLAKAQGARSSPQQVEKSRESVAKPAVPPRDSTATDHQVVAGFRAEASSDLDYILRKNDNTAWYCVICSLRLDDHSIRNHTTDKSHGIFFKRFGCDAVITRDDWYYCRYCDLDVSSREKVYAHVVGKKHQISLIALNTGEPKELALRLAQMRIVS